LLLYPAPTGDKDLDCPGNLSTHAGARLTLVIFFNTLPGKDFFNKLIRFSKLVLIVVNKYFFYVNLLSSEKKDLLDGNYL